MELLLDLLERKNLCFKSFHKLCTEFLPEIEKGDATHLEDFQRKRKNLIDVIEQLEFEVKHTMQAFDSQPGLLEAQITPEARQKLDQLLREKTSYVTSILDLDLQILAHVDRIKDETIQKLQSIQAGKKTLGAYRSPIEKINAAEGLSRLDEEV